MLECFLALRGTRTLALRLRQAQSSAQQLAARLHGHPAPNRVRYPGFGTIVSFELENASRRSCLTSDGHHPPRDEPRRHTDIDAAQERSPTPAAHTPGT
jgi:hypothetical protein